MEAIPRNLASTIFGLLSLGILLTTGCKLGSNDPQIQNAFEMLRIERDAAEDQYYQAKMKQEQAQWRIEELEQQLKQAQENGAPTTVAPDDAEQLGANTTGNVSYQQNEYPRSAAIGNFSSEQISTSASFVPTDDDLTVASIEIDPNLTRGFHDRGKPGDDGTIIAFRALNRFGKPLNAVGKVRISLTDPARQNIRGFVGTWDVAEEDVAEWYDDKANAFVFKLPWLRGTPKNPDLKANVQFDDGEFIYETSADLHIVLDGQPKSRWTKAPAQSSITDVTLPNLNDPQLANSENSKTIQNSTGVQNSTGAEENNEPRIARPKWTPYR